MTSTRDGIRWMLRVAGPPAGILFAVCILLLFPPAKYGFYPECPFHEFFHLQCPGCGATRALAALLHGQLSEALRLNALTVLLAPLAASYGIACYRRFLRHKPLRWPQPRSFSIYAALAVITVFTVIRNLPLHFF
jgi:hypothetical protein